MTLECGSISTSRALVQLERRPVGGVTVSLEKGVYKCFGIETKKDLRSMMNDVTAMNVLSVAVADAVAHSGTVEGVQIRLGNKNRRDCLIDAVKFELVTRMNERIAQNRIVDGDRPRLPLHHLAGSINNARRHAVRVAEMAL